jgi:hypothetical protein
MGDKDGPTVSWRTVVIMMIPLLVVTIGAMVFVSTLLVRVVTIAGLGFAAMVGTALILVHRYNKR